MLSSGTTALILFGPIVAYLVVLMPLLWWAERRALAAGGEGTAGCC